MILRSICCVCARKKLIEQSNAKIKIKAFSDTQRQNCWQNQLIFPQNSYLRLQITPFPLFQCCLTIFFAQVALWNASINIESGGEGVAVVGEDIWCSKMGTYFTREKGLWKSFAKSFCRWVSEYRYFQKRAQIPFWQDFSIGNSQSGLENDEKAIN